MGWQVEQLQIKAFPVWSSPLPWIGEVAGGKPCPLNLICKLQIFVNPCSGKQTNTCTKAHTFKQPNPILSPAVAMQLKAKEGRRRLHLMLQCGEQSGCLGEMRENIFPYPSISPLITNESAWTYTRTKLEHVWEDIEDVLGGFIGDSG